MNKGKITLIVVVSFLVLLGILFAFWQRKGEILSASGTIEATEVLVSSKVMGKVLEVKVKEGEEVTLGEVLAVIDAQEIMANLKGVRARYLLAKNDWERCQKLWQEGVITKQQYDQAQANLESAASALESAELALENTVVRSPLRGFVLTRAVEPGELVTVGSPIVSVADLSELDLMVYLAEKDIGKVRLGEEVKVLVDAFPGEKFSGRVAYIAKQAEFTPKMIQTKEERITQVFGVKIKLSNPDFKLKPGMPADVEFPWNMSSKL